MQNKTDVIIIYEIFNTETKWTVLLRLRYYYNARLEEVDEITACAVIAECSHLISFSVERKP